MKYKVTLKKYLKLFLECQEFKIYDFYNSIDLITEGTNEQIKKIHLKGRLKDFRVVTSYTASANGDVIIVHVKKKEKEA